MRLTFGGPAGGFFELARAVALPFAGLAGAQALPKRGAVATGGADPDVADAVGGEGGDVADVFAVDAMGGEVGDAAVALPDAVRSNVDAAAEAAADAAADADAAAAAESADGAVFRASVGASDGWFVATAAVVAAAAMDGTAEVPIAVEPALPGPCITRKIPAPPAASRHAPTTPSMTAKVDCDAFWDAGRAVATCIGAFVVAPKDACAAAPFRPR